MYAGNAFGWSYPGQGPFQASIPKSSSDSGTGTDVISGFKFVVYEPGAVQQYSDFPIKFTSYNQVLGSYPTYSAIASGPAPLPQLSEVAIIKFGQTGADVNGPTTETPVLVAQLTNNDPTGPETEVAAIRTSVSDANGTTIEVASVRVSATDQNGTVSEIISLAQVVSDTNGLSEIASLQQVTADANGTTSEVAAIKLGVTTDQNGATSEIISLAQIVSDANGTTSEITSLRLVLSDANGATSEIGNITFATADTNGVTTETTGITSPVLVTDSNGAVTEIILKVGVLSGDSGSASEQTSLYFSLIVYEPGTVDTYAAFPQMFQAYTGISTAYPTYNSITTGPAPLPQLVEYAVAGSVRSTTDVSGPITENSVLTAQLAGSDAGTITEAVTLAKTSADSGTITEVVSSIVITIADAGTVSETTRITQATADVNSGIAEATALSAKVSDLDYNGGIVEAAGQIRFSSDSNGTTTESASRVIQIIPISASDVNGAVTEVIALKLGDSEQAGISEVAAIAFRTTDSNGTVTESATFYIQPEFRTDSDSGSVSSVQAVKAVLASADQNGPTYEDQAKILPLQIFTNDYATASEIAAVTKVSVSATDTMGYDKPEIVSLRIPVADAGLGASESASTAFSLQPTLDVGLGADSASTAVTVASSDIGTDFETAGLGALRSTADQNTATAEIAGITYSVIRTDSGTSVEGQRIGISLSDRSSAVESATLGLLLFVVTDFNSTTLEFVNVVKHGQAPAGKVPMLTAVDGIDKTYLTAVMGDQG